MRLINKSKIEKSDHANRWLKYGTTWTHKTAFIWGPCLLRRNGSWCYKAITQYITSPSAGDR